MQQFDLGRTDEGLFKIVVDGKEIVVDATEEAVFFEPHTKTPDGSVPMPVVVERLRTRYGVTASWANAERFALAVCEVLDTLKKTVPLTPDSPSTSTSTPEPSAAPSA